MFDPSPEQKLILDGNFHALVDAGPGTGKSAMALELTRKIAKSLKKPQKVLFLSFSNAAVNRLAATAGITLDAVKSNLSFMTYHALAWEIVRTHGRLWGLSNRLSVLDEVEFLLAVASSQLKSDANSYNDFLQFAKANQKISFEIMVPLAVKILNSSSEIRRIESKRFPLVIADEFQDTNQEQWELLRAIGDQSRVIALGDLNQVIYGKDYEAAKNLFEEFKRWKAIQTSPFSPHSYRCKNNHILDFSYDLVNSRITNLNNSTVQVRSCYRNQLRSMVATTCASILKTSQAQGKSIGILTGSAAVAQKLAIDLKVPPEGAVMQMPIHAKIPISETRKESFRLAALSLYQFKKIKNEKNLVNAARALMALKTNWAVKKLKKPVLYKDVVKELSAPKNKNSKKPIYDLIMSEIPVDFKSFESILKEALKSSSFFSSAGESINSIGHSLINSESNLSAQMEFPFEHFRETRSPKGLYGDTIAGGRVEILSMWKSKGREFDHVIIVFDPRDFSQNVSVETEKRLFYVACTRAKEWLGIIYPTGSPGRVLAQTLGLR